MISVQIDFSMWAVSSSLPHSDCISLCRHVMWTLMIFRRNKPSIRPSILPFRSPWTDWHQTNVTMHVFSWWWLFSLCMILSRYLFLRVHCSCVWWLCARFAIHSQGIYEVALSWYDWCVGKAWNYLHWWMGFVFSHICAVSMSWLVSVFYVCHLKSPWF